MRVETGRVEGIGGKALGGFQCSTSDTVYIQRVELSSRIFCGRPEFVAVSHVEGFPRVWVGMKHRLFYLGCRYRPGFRICAKRRFFGCE